jgi:hypothetical protein
VNRGKYRQYSERIVMKKVFKNSRPLKCISYIKMA